MVHAVLAGTGDVIRAATFLRGMRNDMEQGAAA
jgi:hypothetical protein